jgi:hypothetical protein
VLDVISEVGLVPLLELLTDSSSGMMFTDALPVFDGAQVDEIWKFHR